MSLSSELISQFVKATRDKNAAKHETTVYGTTMVSDGEMYVQLDGSDILTPIATTADIQSGERVMVMIKNHTATIIGSTSAPSATSKTVSAVSEKIANVEGNAEEAAKVATNYMELDEDAGLVVGNMTEDVLSKNVKIDSDSVDICDGDTVLASFGADTIYLGKNSQDAVIDMCDGQARIYTDEHIAFGEELVLEAPCTLALQSNDRVLTVAGYTHPETGIVGTVMVEARCNDLNQNVGGYYDVYSRTQETNRDCLAQMTFDTLNGYVVLKMEGEENAAIQLDESGKILFQAVGNTYKPYYTAGDVIDMYWDGAGFITSSSRKVLFSVPLAKPLLGNPTVTVTSTDGLRVRQGNKYLYGSTDSSYATVSSYEASGLNSGDNFVRISATMPNTTNVVSNNDTCGISAHIRLTLS